MMIALSIEESLSFLNTNIELPISIGNVSVTSFNSEDCRTEVSRDGKLVSCEV